MNECSAFSTLQQSNRRRFCGTPLPRASSKRGSIQKLGRWKTISMVLRYAHHQPESLRSGAEVLDRLRRENSTKVAQWEGVPRGGCPECGGGVSA